MADPSALRVSRLDPPLHFPPLFDVRAAEAAALPRAAIDLNVGWVIEQPRETTSALSSLLHLSRRPPPPLPPVLSLLPEVTREDFEPYIALLRAGRGSKPADEFSADPGYSVLPRAADSAGASRSDSAISSPTRATSALSSSDAFESVPELFFQAEFNLSERGTLSGIIAGEAGSVDKAQAALTSHLDAVECQLLSLIHSRAPRFFVALRDLQELQALVASANSTAMGLQARCARIKQQCVVQPLFVVAASRRKQHATAAAVLMRQLRDTAHAVKEVGQQVCASVDLREEQRLPSSCARLLAPAPAQVSVHQYDKALRCIARTRGRIRRGLHGVRAAVALGARLAAYERLIGDTLIGNYSSAALSYALVGVPSTSVEGASEPPGPTDAAPVSIGLEAFLLGAFPAASSSSGGGSGSGGSVPFATVPASATVGDDSLLVSEVLPLLASLIRARRLDAAMEAFQGRFLAGLGGMFEAEVAEATRAVAEAADGGGGDGGAASTAGGGAFDCTQTLGPDDFISVAGSVSRGCVDMLRRVHALHDMVERSLSAHDVASAAASAAAGAPGDLDLLDVRADEDLASLQASGDVAALRALSSGVMAVCVEAVQVRRRGRAGDDRLPCHDARAPLAPPFLERVYPPPCCEARRERAHEDKAAPRAVGRLCDLLVQGPRAARLGRLRGHHCPRRSRSCARSAAHTS